MGAFGLVCSAKFGPNANGRAIKKITNYGSNKVMAKRSYRELSLLAQLKNENIIAITDAFLSGADLYLVTELLPFDLARVIQSKGSIEPQHCKYFTYQILRGLKYVHSAGIIHRDLKPSNLLINEFCDLKICIFSNNLKVFSN